MALDFVFSYEHLPIRINSIVTELMRKQYQKTVNAVLLYLRRRTELAANKAPAEAGAIDVLDWLC